MVACLKSYVHLHFAEEERLMRETGYERYAEHRKEHEELAARVEELVTALQRREVERKALSSVLGEWIRDHIMKSDREFAASLRSQAVKRV